MGRWCQLTSVFFFKITNNLGHFLSCTHLGSVCCCSPGSYGCEVVLSICHVVSHLQGLVLLSAGLVGEMSLGLLLGNIRI
jgi:hypothetical protein